MGDRLMKLAGIIGNEAVDKSQESGKVDSGLVKVNLGNVVNSTKKRLSDILTSKGGNDGQNVGKDQKIDSDQKRQNEPETTDAADIEDSNVVGEQKSQETLPENDKKQVDETENKQDASLDVLPEDVVKGVESVKTNVKQKDSEVTGASDESLSDADDEAITKNFSAKERAAWATQRKELKAYKTKVKELESKLKEAESIKEKLKDYDELKSKLDEYEAKLQKYDLENSPAFKLRYDKPLSDLKGKMISILVKTGLNEEDAKTRVDELVVRSSDLDSAASLLTDVPYLVQGSLSTLLMEYDTAKNAREKALEDWKSTKDVVENDLDTLYQTEVVKLLDTDIPSAADELAREGSFLLKPSATDDNWNSLVNKRLSKIKSIIKSADKRELLKYTIDGILSKDYRGLFNNLLDLYNKTKAELDEYVKANPELSARDVIGKQTKREIPIQSATEANKLQAKIRQIIS